MLVNILEFLVPTSKMCTTCGGEIIEQHECYGNKCDSCNII